MRSKRFASAAILLFFSGFFLDPLTDFHQFPHSRDLSGTVLTHLSFSPLQKNFVAILTFHPDHFPNLLTYCP